MGAVVVRWGSRGRGVGVGVGVGMLLVEEVVVEVVVKVVVVTVLMYERTTCKRCSGPGIGRTGGGVGRRVCSLWEEVRGVC